jgi:hypothetical protein
MGSFNATCTVSNLHITAGTDVVVVMLIENMTNTSSLCYTTAYNKVAPVLMYGKYDDYGGVEDLEPYGEKMIVESLRKKLYRFGQGPNPYHDIEVTKEGFCTEKLFEADHEGRLGIENNHAWDRDTYDLSVLQKKYDGSAVTESQSPGLSESEMYELNRLSAKIRNEDNFQRVRHTVIRRDIFDAIMSNWYYKNYEGEGLGNTGYKNSYKRIDLALIKSFIPAYVAKVRAVHEAAALMTDKMTAYTTTREIFSWNDENIAGRMLTQIGATGESNPFALIHVKTTLDYLSENAKWDDLATFAEEVLTTNWLTSYMESIHRPWVKPPTGGQEADSVPHRVLANAVNAVLDEEERIYKEENEFNEDEE